jgi:hypothetical protein
MKTILLFAGILFPVLSTIVIVEVPWLEGTPEMLSLMSGFGMFLIFLSGRYEAAAAFYLLVGLSNAGAIMLPMILPLWALTPVAYFLSATYLTFHVLDAYGEANAGRPAAIHSSMDKIG